MVKIGDQFATIAEACTAITSFVLDRDELYKVLKSEAKRYIIGCKDASCKFCVRATRSTKEVVSVTVLVEHSCSPSIYYIAQLAVIYQESLKRNK
jgi:hypothetical protein